MNLKNAHKLKCAGLDGLLSVNIGTGFKTMAIFPHLSVENINVMLRLRTIPKLWLLVQLQIIILMLFDGETKMTCCIFHIWEENRKKSITLLRNKKII